MFVSYNLRKQLACNIVNNFGRWGLLDAYTEEAWNYLGRLVQQEQSRLDTENDYDAIFRNCANFVDVVLRKIGFEDGLIDKFDLRDFVNLPIGPLKLVKPFMLNYFRVSKHEQFASFVEATSFVPMMSPAVHEPYDLSVYMDKVLSHLPGCEEARKADELKSHINFVNGFIDDDFYQDKDAELKEEAAQATKEKTSARPLTVMESAALDGFQFAYDSMWQQGMLFGYNGRLPTANELAEQAVYLAEFSAAALEEASKKSGNAQAQKPAPK